MKASLVQKTKKLFGGFFGFKTFLTVFLIALFFNIGIVKAQTPGPVSVNFDEFICLFEKVDSNEKCNNINPTEEEVKSATASGLAKGRVDVFTKEGVTPAGITALTMQIGLLIDEKREKKEINYFYSRVADDRDETFLIRIKYTKQGESEPTYKLISVPYSKKDFSRPSADIFNITDKTSSVVVKRDGGANQFGIAFYKDTVNGGALVKQQLVLAESNLPLYLDDPIPYGQEVFADLWYCGGEKKGSSNIDGRYAPRDGERVEYFTTDGRYTDIRGLQTDGGKYKTTKCGGTAHYKIGKTISFKMPTNFQEATVDASQELESGIISSEYLGSVLPLCSITPFTNGSVMGCVAQILYGGVFRPVAFFAQLMGNIFDFFLGYSLSDESYRHDFVQTGWQLVRDISNIFFIIIMIWSGLVAIFDTKKASYKTVIPTLIINALIINFSLFATRVVIDLSNITARIFYNQMVVKVDGEIAPSSSGFKPISEAIVSSFNPQSIFRNSVLQSEQVSPDGETSSESESVSFNSQSNVVENNGGFKRYSKEYASYFALVTLIAIMISFSVAIMFWKTAFIFIGRVVGLYIAMIFSPFAFLSRGKLPLVGNIPGINYSAWWKDLTQYALLAPIFVFFLYIINAFLNVEFFTKVGLDQNGQGFFGSVMYVLIPMLIIYGLVTKGVDVAKRFSGSLGEMAQKFGTGAVGVVGGAAIGVASGGLAFAGTRASGMLRLSETKRAELLESKSRGGLSGRLASLRLGLNDRAQSGSFDIRKSSAFSGVNKLAGNLGVKLKDDVSSRLKLDSDATKGGIKGVEKREKEALKKKIESIKTDMKEDEVKAFWEKRSAKLMEKEKEKLNKDEAALIQAHKDSGKSDDQITEMRTNNTLKDSLDELAKSNIDKKYGKVGNNKQLTQALRLQFADTIAEGKTFGQSAKAKVLKGLAIADVATAGSLNRAIISGAATNPLAVPALATVIYDSARSSKLDREEAKSYAKKAREALSNKNKLPKEERLENQKKTIEKDLESIDKTLKKIFEKEISLNPTVHTGKTAQDFFNSPELAEDAIKKARRRMKDEMDILDIDIDMFRKQYHDAVTAGKTAEAEIARSNMIGKTVEKGRIKDEHDEIDPSLKQRKQADLNKKDDELEREKEKQKKDSEKGGGDKDKK